jgi:aspartate/methionine/tyrosine aminotransferase
MESIAQDLNTLLKGCVVDTLLTDAGKRLYFPQGIVSQSQEAIKEKAVINATAGVALQDGHYITHPLFDEFSDIVSSDEMVSYAPTAGVLQLRKAWMEHIHCENPLLNEHHHSLPVVTSGLTHAISVISQLFIDDDSDVIIFNPCWDNYHLIFNVLHQAHIHNVSLFNRNGVLDIAGWKEECNQIHSEKLVFLFNFPNNPTGYTPSTKEMKDIADLLMDVASKGKKILSIIDDAYFGLFHTDSCSSNSLFVYLANAHENILAVKCDAATKESLVWGFRVGFITYGAKNLLPTHYDALIEKTKGAVRSSISSASMISQSLLLKVLTSSEYSATIQRVKDEMKRRYDRVIQSVLLYLGNDDILIPFPSNSGYFISFYYKGDAISLRIALLKKGIAVVSLGEHIIRIAYSAVNVEAIDELVDAIVIGARTLWK